jgi:hypothetical protein
MRPPLGERLAHELVPLVAERLGTGERPLIAGACVLKFYGGHARV